MAETMQVDSNATASTSTAAVNTLTTTTNTNATKNNLQNNDGGKEKEKEKVIRITNHGKMKSWIANALTFFEDVDPSKSVTFHTLPLIASPDSALQPTNQGGKEPSAPILNPESTSTPASNPMPTSTQTIPRLISTIEILKREFSKHLEATRSPRLEGLHQYNEIGTLEALGLTGNKDVGSEGGADAEVQRAQGILHALSGRNHPRQTQTPYMRITLSLSERPELVEKGATYQPPSKRTLSKSGKQRAKKRAKKTLLGLEAEAGVAVEVVGGPTAAADNTANANPIRNSGKSQRQGNGNGNGKGQGHGQIQTQTERKRKRQDDGEDPPVTKAQAQAQAQS